MKLDSGFDISLRSRIAGEFLRYFVVSLAALAVDISLLLQLAKVMYPIAAATISFSVGLLVCYGLTVRFVFSTRRFGAERAKEITIFFLVGLIGLVVNDLVIYLTHLVLMLSLVLSKLSAAAVSFLFNFMGRKLLLFRYVSTNSEVSQQGPATQNS